ncbi:hypothetical protein HA402_008846 [Bradysia odoriphaga]|nr:hypothetical protein HA402_008846 [Bradysia odoriphaga]
MPDPVVCAKCEKAIEGESLTALDKNWHPEHFVCKLCEKPITSEQFVEHEGSPVCGKCNTAKLCEKCFQCKKPITGKVLKAMNQVWHEDHFVCSGPCKKPLSGTEFFERETKPYCKPDFEKLFGAKKAPAKTLK